MKILHCLQSSTVIVLIWSNKYMQQFWQFLTINWFPLISPGALITVWSFRFSIRYSELSVGLLSQEYTFWGGSAEILESNSNFFLYIYVWFISYSKCSNWRQISKLASNFGCLFTFCYSAWANLLKTKLQTCNLQTGQSISYKYINSFNWICPIQIAKKWINIQSSTIISIFDAN